MADRDPTETRARIQQHWEASERGDADAEHAIYAEGVMELSDGLVIHETQYFADPFDAPDARATLAEPMSQRGI